MAVKACKNFRSIWTLNRKQTGLFGNIMHFCIVLIVMRKPIPIFFNIRSIDNKHVNLILFNAIDQQIVNNSSIIVCKTTVLGLALSLISTHHLLLLSG